MHQTPPLRLFSPRSHPAPRKGELWLLGEHRLFCGDCTRPETVERLMGGKGMEGADLLLTDPPYGVDYAGKARSVNRWSAPALPMANDAIGDAGVRALLADALRVAPLRPGGAFYVFSPPGRTETSFRLALQDSGLELRQSIVWAKHAFVLSRQDYHWQHETVLYGWKAGAAHRFEGGRRQSTVWQADRPMRNKLHPTMKPVALLARAIANSSLPGDIVFDGFGGSGSTLLACEATGRRCRMAEIDPAYCRVIVGRWEATTGRRASRTG